MAHNSIPSDNPSSVAQALENAIALAVSRANAIVGDGTASPHGLAAADPDALADALEAANTFLGKLELIRRELVAEELGRRARGTSPEETVIDNGSPRAPARAEPEVGDPDPKTEHDTAVNDALASLRTIHGIAAAILDGARDDVLDALHGAIYREAQRGEAALDSRAVWRS